MGAQPDVFAACCAALEAPENQGIRFDGVRKILYEKLVQSDTSRAVAVILARMARENAGVRRHLYDLVSRLESSEVAACLVGAFQTEEPAVRDFVGTIVWRHALATERLLGELPRAWTEDPAFARRIVALVREECLPVPPDVVAASPAELRRLLGK